MTSSPIMIDRRVTLKWLMGAMAAGQLAACGDGAKGVTWAEMEAIKAKGYGTDPDFNTTTAPWPLTMTEAELVAASTLADIFAGVDCVFHTAAHVKMWGPREAFVRGNISATENVIAACRAAGVGKLVFENADNCAKTRPRIHEKTARRQLVHHLRQFLNGIFLLRTPTDHKVEVFNVTGRLWIKNKNVLHKGVFPFVKFAQNL